jgi:hypothetical protein
MPKMNPKKDTDDTDQDGSVKKIQRAPALIRGNCFLSVNISANPWLLFFIREQQR